MAAVVFMLLVFVLGVAALVVVHLRTSGVYGASSTEAANLAREQARIRQEARDASWEIHRRVNAALTEMMEAARDAQRRGSGPWQ